MQIAGTPPIDWSGHAARHVERRNQREAGAGAVRDRTGSPSAAPVAKEPPVSQEARATRQKATVEQQIAKLEPRIDRFINRLGVRLGLDDGALEALTAQITALQEQYVGEGLREGVTAGEPGAHGSYRAAVAHLIHTWRQAAEDVVPTEGGEGPAEEIDPVAGDVDPVTGDTEAVDEAGAGEVVVVDPPDLMLPVVPPETTDPVELLDVLLTGVPADE